TRILPHFTIATLRAAEEFARVQIDRAAHGHPLLQADDPAGLHAARGAHARQVHARRERCAGARASVPDDALRAGGETAQVAMPKALALYVEHVEGLHALGIAH